VCGEGEVSGREMEVEVAGERVFVEGLERGWRLGWVRKVRRMTRRSQKSGGWRHWNWVVVC